MVQAWRCPSCSDRGSGTCTLWKAGSSLASHPHPGSALPTDQRIWIFIPRTLCQTPTEAHAVHLALDRLRFRKRWPFPRLHSKGPTRCPSPGKRVLPAITGGSAPGELPASGPGPALRVRAEGERRAPTGRRSRPVLRRLLSAVPAPGASGERSWAPHHAAPRRSTDCPLPTLRT